ncbi:MAG: hypothetical protein H6739_27885 [Alphaproteobacteria bacterium]|nr:hypothetical protein [Alphaproteobacteria bacterium]
MLATLLLALLPPAHAAPSLGVHVHAGVAGPRIAASVRWGEGTWQSGPMLGGRALGWRLGERSMTPLADSYSLWELADAAAFPMVGWMAYGWMSERWTLTVGVNGRPLGVAELIWTERGSVHGPRDLLHLAFVAGVAAPPAYFEGTLGFHRRLRGGPFGLWSGVQVSGTPLLLTAERPVVLSCINPGVGVVYGL